MKDKSHTVDLDFSKKNTAKQQQYFACCVILEPLRSFKASRVFAGTTLKTRLSFKQGSIVSLRFTTKFWKGCFNVSY